MKYDFLSLRLVQILVAKVRVKPKRQDETHGTEKINESSER